MTDLEIPYEKDRKGHYRFFEILPGFLSWTLILLPLVLSYFSVIAAVAFILIYLLIFFIRSVGYDIRAVQGYFDMKKQLKLNWTTLVDELHFKKIFDDKDIVRPKWHFSNLKRLDTRKVETDPYDLVHIALIATYNESREILEPTIQSIIASTYDSKKIIIVIAYEARAGKSAEDRVKELKKVYKNQFRDFLIIKHPSNIPGEIIGKGSNITYAGRQIKDYAKKNSLDPKKVLITTLDADNRPDRNYFMALTYLFCVVPDPIRASFQPLPMFTNNIWDAPTFMRVVATGNNLFYIVQTQRPHLARNFSAHAQSLQALIEMDFWSVRTIVEDGHQFWRSYFKFDGDYRVYPLTIPIYQDAVLAEGYLRTMKAQFIQLRRWTYGASDIAYIVDKGFFHKNNISKIDLIEKFLRTLEGHVTWATGTLLIYFAAFIPALLNAHSLAANELPVIVSQVQQYGIIGLLASFYICLITLPPRPSRYKRHRSILMIVQWIFLPITSIVYGSLAAFDSQTRLMFKRYLSKFDVTEKAVFNRKTK